MAETLALSSSESLEPLMALAASLVKLPLEHVWMDYDREADVLYLSFRRPQRATETVETDDGILIRKDGDSVVGITILDASTRSGGGQ